MNIVKNNDFYCNFDQNFTHQLNCMHGEERVKTVQFILGRWVEAVGMCLMEGDNVATRNLRSSAETLHASISLEQ